MRSAVKLHINAPPDKVWGLISDITKMGEYSPEVIEAEWLDGSTGPAVGARYRGHVKRNENWPVLYWTTCKVTECVPGEVFEFAVIMRDRPVNTWRYEFRPTDGEGTDVTSRSISATTSSPRSGIRSAASCGTVATSVTCSAPSNESKQSQRARSCRSEAQLSHPRGERGHPGTVVIDTLCRRIQRGSSRSMP
jgi:uncharacterized protein YndB with AHSA1/START domain